MKNLEIGSKILDNNNYRIIEVLKIDHSSKTAFCEVTEEDEDGNEKTEKALFTLSELNNNRYKKL